MIYTVELKTAGLVTGAVLALSHLFALLSGGKLAGLLPKLPRSKIAGTILLTVAAVWSFVLLRTMDLGEFAHLRNILSGVVVAAYFLTLFFVDEFLAVRALGMNALLAACVLLDAAFLKPEITRLALVGLAYVWIIAGMFWVGTPYVLRDQIQWVTAQPWRLRAASVGGLVYGLLLLVLAWTRY